ncbi:unnamed protein product [Ostreobium quekettii]|uniref:ribonuclease Z n=1 Tax=Ostreobium quekettii TaxID=121088 RepID=A0A8S1J524_9CHLO|nr:unnamed protein product [Ostreobium quekettii]
MYRSNFVFCAEVVVADSDGIAPTILLTTPLKKYHFNIAEGFSRLAMEHGVKVDNSCSIFFTFDHSPASVGGLGGLLYRLRDVGATKILFVGPKGISDVLEGFKMLSYFKAPMMPSCCPLTKKSQGVVYRDDFIDVAAAMKNWERSTVPSWLGACPCWIRNPCKGKQVIDLVGDEEEELVDVEVDEGKQDVIVIDVDESDDDADRQSIDCLTDEELPPVGSMIDLLTSDDEDSGAQTTEPAAGHPIRLTCPPSASTPQEGMVTAVGPSRNQLKGSRARTLPGHPDTDVGCPGVEAAGVCCKAIQNPDVISLITPSTSTGEEDYIPLPQRGSDLVQGGIARGVKRIKLDDGPEGAGRGSQRSSAQSGPCQAGSGTQSLWSPNGSYQGPWGLPTGVGASCLPSQPFAQGAVGPKDGKNAARKEALSLSAAEEVEPVLAYVIQFKATEQLLAIIRLPDLDSKQDLEAHPVFKGLKASRSRVSAIFHISSESLLGQPAYQKWARCLPGKQIFMKREATAALEEPQFGHSIRRSLEGSAEEYGHQKALELTGRLHAVSPLLFPLPSKVRKEPMDVEVQKGTQRKSTLEGGLLFRVEQLHRRELDVIPGSPVITPLGLGIDTIANGHQWILRGTHEVGAYLYHGFLI